MSQKKERVLEIKKNNPLVSVIIPVFNGSNFMREAIDSALAQTYRNIEVIVVNDGSTDNTDEIANSYGKKIRYFKKENGGVSSALNLALKEMKGDYFSWLSHDDVYYKEKIEKQVEFLNTQRNNNIILYSDFALIDENSKIKQVVHLDHALLEEKPEYAILRSSINGNTLLVPRNAFKEYGYFDETLTCAQDYAKWFEFLQSYSFVHLPEVLIKYREHKNQDTKKNQKFVTEGNELWIQMIEKLPKQTKIKLEGSIPNFFIRMHEFLKVTPFEMASDFANEEFCKSLEKVKKESFSVVLISHSSNLEGAERAMLNTISGLVEKNAYIYIVLPSNGPIETELQNKGIDYSIQRLSLAVTSKGLKNEYIKSRIYKDALELKNLLKKIKPNVVISGSSVIFEGALAAKILAIPHVWTISEFGKEEHGIKFLLRQKERINFVKEFSDKVVFVSRTLQDEYSKTGSIKNSFVFPPISKEEILRADKTGITYFENKNALKVALLGNIHRGKGQKDAVFAASELLKRGIKDFEIIIVGPVGDKYYAKELKEIVNFRKLADKVKFFPSSKNSTDLFKGADLVLNCSVYESYGRVTAEAMFYKKPVIGANSGATPELIKDNESGFLYQPGNFFELANKIEYFYKNRKQIAKFGDRGFLIISKKLDDKRLLDEYYQELYGLRNKKEKNINLKNKVVINLRESYDKYQKLLDQEDIIYEASIIKKASYLLRTRGTLGTLNTAGRVAKKRLTLKNK